MVDSNKEKQNDQESNKQKDSVDNNKIYGSFHSAKDQKSEIVFFQDL